MTRHLRFTLRLLLLSALLCTCLRLAPAEAKAAPSPLTSAGPFWFSPVVDLLKSVISQFKGKNEVKQMLPKSLEKMSADASSLDAIPALLHDSRDLRETAITLAQMIDVGSNDALVADHIWKQVGFKTQSVQQKFERVYGQKEFRALLLSRSDFQEKEAGGRDSLGKISDILNATGTSPGDRKAALGRIQALMQPVTSAANYFEVWTGTTSATMVENYKQLIGDLKSVAPKNSGSEMSATNSDGILISARLHPKTRARLSLVSGILPAPQALTQMKEDADAPVRAPAWMLETIKITRSNENGFPNAGQELIKFPQWIGTLIGLSLGMVSGIGFQWIREKRSSEKER